MASEMGTLNYTIVDAFTSTPFGGNPAAVVVLPPTATLRDSLIQPIAAEFNLIITALVTPIYEMAQKEADGSSSSRSFVLRWFTPTMEIPLCGHATLATARVIFSTTPESVTELNFQTLSGILTARKVAGGRQIELEFPAVATTPVDADVQARVVEVVNEAVGGPVNVLNVSTDGRWWLVHLDPGFDLDNAKFNAAPFSSCKDIGVRNVILTSNRPTAGATFISRVFSPAFGYGEDPATGSSQCLLMPYWSRALGVAPGELIHARQVSRRGGVVGLIWDEVKGTVKMQGDATVMARGEMYVQ